MQVLRAGTDVDCGGFVGKYIANATATVAGDLSGEIANDGTAAVTGMATVSDTDGADEFTPLTDEASSYGTFSITAAGVWTYTLDTTNQMVADLVGTNLTDSLFVEAADGSPATITITITGGSLTNNVAKISDSDDGDTGELYYKFDDGGDTVEAYTLVYDLIHVNKSSTQVQNQECNYADNYYGDQVCTIKKHKSS